MIQIPVFNATSAAFEQQITLGDQTLTLAMQWNARGGHWFLDIKTAEGQDLLTSRKLVPILPVCYSHRALANISGDFVLLPESEASPEYPTFEGLGTTHNLYWMDDTETANWEAFLGI